MSFGSGQAALARTLLPSPTMRLPFPSVVVDSRASSIIVHVLALADIWQSPFVDAEKFPGWPGVQTLAPGQSTLPGRAQLAQSGRRLRN